MSKHAATDRDESRFYTEATCDTVRTGRANCGYACPRHQPVDYSENYARHATDSIGPSSLWSDPVAREAFAVQTTAERFHNWGVTR